MGLGQRAQRQALRFGGLAAARGDEDDRSVAARGGPGPRPGRPSDAAPGIGQLRMLRTARFGAA